MTLKDRTDEFDYSDIEANKTVCGLSYLGILFFLPLVCCTGSDFGKFHANQSLVLLILAVAAGVVFGILKAIMNAVGLFVIATIINILSVIVYLPLTILFLMGLITAFQGKAVELPITGGIHILK